MKDQRLRLWLAAAIMQHTAVSEEENAWMSQTLTTWGNRAPATAEEIEALEKILEEYEKKCYNDW